MNIFKRIQETNDLINLLSKQALTSDKARAVAYDYRTLHSKLSLWMSNGAKIFRLSKELIDAFSMTDIPLDIQADDFKYPFDTFIVDGEKPLYQVDIRRDTITNVHAILFTDKRVVNTDSNTLLMTPDDQIRNEIEWDISLSGLTPGSEGYALDHMWVNMRNGESVISACNQPSNREYRDTVTIPEAQKAVNIFFNTVMYINDMSRNKNETETVCKAKYKVGGGKKNTVRCEYIRLSPPKSYISANKEWSGRTIDKRFRVRGHWTNQAYGKGRSLRRRQWIFPYWKGPEMNEMVSKVYKVG